MAYRSKASLVATSSVPLCRAMGIAYSEMEAGDGVFLAVAEASCRYLWPARYDEQVTVRTRIAQSHARMVTFAYEMRTDRPVAKGETKHVFCGQDMKPVKLPRKYWDLFGVNSH